MKDTIRQALITGAKNALHLPQGTLSSACFYTCTHIMSIGMKYVSDSEYGLLHETLLSLGEKYTHILQERLDNGEYCKESNQPKTMQTFNPAFIHAFCWRIATTKEWEAKMYDERVAWLNWLLVELEGETNE